MMSMPLSQWTENPLLWNLTEHWLHPIHPWELHHILVCDGYHNLLKSGGDASRRGEIDQSRHEMKGILAKGDIGCLNELQTQEKTFIKSYQHSLLVKWWKCAMCWGALWDEADYQMVRLARHIGKCECICFQWCMNFLPGCNEWYVYFLLIVTSCSCGRVAYMLSSVWVYWRVLNSVCIGSTACVFWALTFCFFICIYETCVWCWASLIIRDTVTVYYTLHGGCGRSRVAC